MAAALAAGLAFALPVTAGAALRISEFMASNDGVSLDEDGDSSDWIEIENTGLTPLSTDGWFLTDSALDLNRWRIPDVAIPPGGHLIVFASGKNRSVAGSELHTNFQLDSGGEFLALVEPDGLTIATQFAPEFPEQKTDVSYGIGIDAQETSLVTPNSPARFHVPSDGSLGQTWTAQAFDDSGWAAVSAGVGYQVDTGGAGAGQPQAYWDFDGNAADQTGGGADGTLIGAGYSSSKPPGGGSNSALLDGGGDYITANLDVSEATYTSSLWFRTTDPNAGLFTVVDSDLGVGGHDRHLYLTGGNIGARVWNNETITTAGLSLADGNWHHVAHVYGGATGGQRIYVDGVFAAGGSKALSDFNWQQRVNIGFSNDAGQQHFTGEIDEVAVWAEALDASQVGALASGVSPQALGGFDPVIVSDVETEMRNVHPTAYLRVGFDAPGHGDFDRLELRVRYDDGFIAYLNGVEVARREAPAAAAWDSTATTNRPNEEVLVPEAIDISAHLGLLSPTGNSLAFHALNNGATSSNFLLLPELVGLDIEENGARFFTVPTPGNANDTGVAGFVADTKFSHDRGYYDAPISVSITSTTPGATVVYTVDGSKPSLANGTAVPAADANSTPEAIVQVTTTTNLRAAAFRDGWQPTDVDTHSYIYIDDVETQPANPPGLPATWSGGASADYGVDPDVINSTLPGYSFREALLSIPTMSITSAPGDIFGASAGIYYNSQGRGRPWEREISLEMFYPDGSTAFQENCGARMHGNSSRSHGFTRKHPFRIVFRNEYGAGKLRYQLFPDEDTDEFDLLILRGASTDSFPVTDGPPRWINDKGTYIRDQYMRDTLRDLGNISCGGTYVHLFVNGLYWGLYNPSERPVANFNAKNRGGDKDEYDIIKDFAEVQHGNRTAWEAAMDAAAAGLSSEADYQRYLGNNPDGSRNPAFDVHLHEPSFIDYMITHIAGGAEDWPDHNYWAGRRRGPESDGWHFFAWDQEISNDDLVRDRSHIFPAQPFESVNVANSPAFIYDRIRQNPTFQQKFRDRVHALFFNDGPMTPENNRARWAARQNEIDKAIVAESARWGDARQHPPIKRETLWMSEMDWMQNPGGFWDQNHDRAIQRFRNVGLYPSMDAPAFSRAGGVVTSGAELFFAGAGTVYYTTDGSDPRAPDGSPAASAQAYSGGSQNVTLLAKNAVWKYLDDGSDQGSAWQAPGFDDSSWASGNGQFGYGDGDEATVVDYGPSGIDKHITTYFRTSFNVASAGAVSELSLGLLRDDGAVVYLNGTEIARSNLPTGAINSETTASSNVGGTDETTFYFDFTVDPALLVDGTNILAAEVHQVAPNNSDLSFDATLTAVAQTSVNPVSITASGPINARILDGGEWSGMNSEFFTVGAELASAANTAISELNYRPSGPNADEIAAGFTSAGDFEFLELTNIGALPVELTGANFEAGIDFEFALHASSTEIPVGGSVLIVANTAAFEERYGTGLPVIGEFQNDTALSNGGEQIRLVDGGGAAIRDFVYDDQAPWPTSPDGGGFSLTLIDPMSDPPHGVASSWRASLDPGGSPGRADGAIPYDAWARSWYDPSAPDFATLSAPGANPNSTAVPNGLHFLFGSSPSDPTPPDLELGVVEDGGVEYLSITFSRRPALTGASVQIEQSGDLIGWLAAATVLVSSQADGALVRETHRLTTPLADAERQLLRLRVDL